MIEYIIIGGGILFGLIGFIIGIVLIARAYRESPSIAHYKRVVDILTLRKLWHKKSVPIPEDIITNTKTDHIKHYEDMRDKLTLRKKTELPGTKEEGSGLGLIGTIIGAFVVILIGISILPVITKQVQVVSNSVNSTENSQVANTVFGLVPVFFVIAIATAAIAIVAGALRSSGLV